MSINTVEHETILSDEALVRRCKEELPHVTSSFELLVARHMQRVYTLVYKIVNDHEEAEDLTQEVFLKVYRALPRFDMQCAFTTWLYRIATNTALDAMDRARRTRQQVIHLSRAVKHSQSAREPSEPPLSELPAREPLPEEQALRRELRECINRVLRRLDREQARVLLLRDLEDLSYEELAQVLQARLSAVKMRVHRARLAFKELFGEFCGKIYQVLSIAEQKEKRKKQGSNGKEISV
uniref:RNA polymerase sigma factor n=1 Tax=Thermogemmatispora argillosa TaxID=2045280 RepID=A0A455T175_9CHLR|nr:RNA polymerase sigma factor [Thermogemmatispora argillosa]